MRREVRVGERLERGDLIVSDVGFVTQIDPDLAGKVLNRVFDNMKIMRDEYENKDTSIPVRPETAPW